MKLFLKYFLLFRYKLNEHLPIHCWLEECKRQKIDRFWDLVRIVKERQKDVAQGKWEQRRGLQVEAPAIIGTEEQTVQEREERIRREMLETEIQPKKIFRCLFCGGKFTSMKGKEQHVETCSEKH